MKKTEQFQVSSVSFVGEQDGPPERELKARLVILFNQNDNIRRAYLARHICEYTRQHNHTLSPCKVEQPRGEHDVWPMSRKVTDRSDRPVRLMGRRRH